MSECQNPYLAYQEYEGEQPHILTSRDYEFVSKNNYAFSKVKLLLLPCGKCPNCMKNKALEWTSRLVKEAEEWIYTYFLTLTYDDKHLKNLNKRDCQLFIKRFRESTGFKLKYYISGELGETTKRPHYHAIFFLNEKIPDLVFYGNNLYTSKLLDSTWLLGNVLISSDVNERSIKYTIGYTLKKIGESKIQLMSNGLGLKYLESKKEDIKFSNGFYLNNGFLVNPPSYFIRKMKESSNPEDIAWIAQYQNQPRSSVKLTKTLQEMFLEMVTQKSNTKGKGVF